MNLKSAITGTDDYHAIMREALTEAFRVASGYVAPVLTQDDGLPTIRVCDGARKGGAWVEIGQHLECVGDVHAVVVEVMMCFDCAYSLEHFYRPHLLFWSGLPNNHPCECCGAVYQEDDLPF